MKTPFKSRVILSLVAAWGVSSIPSLLRAASLTASDSAVGAAFGISVSQSGSSGFVGARYNQAGANNFHGVAYVFRNLDTVTGSVTESVNLTASDGARNDFFGSSVSQSGSLGLVGAYNKKIGANSFQGEAYLFRNLDTATGTVTEDVKLTSSDGAAADFFGSSVSQSGSSGLVGAYYKKVGANNQQGAAYVFRNLDTATGTVTEDVKLTSSDGAAGDLFGSSVSQSGNFGLAGASNKKVGANNSQGAAYTFRNLDTASGTITENVKLTSSDGVANDLFGSTVSLSGSIGLVGGFRHKVGANTAQGAAYVFRNLDTASGTITQNIELTSSDGAADDSFGNSVSISGNIGLVGAVNKKVGANNLQGAAYVFRNLDTATGIVTHNLKLTASDGTVSDHFGDSVALDGDQFLIGAYGYNIGPGTGVPGKAYSGSIASITTLDAGNTSKTISGISFVSTDDWIIGHATDNNYVLQSFGDTANVTAADRAIYIGQNAGSDSNKLSIGGNLTATDIYVGSVLGNVGNILELKNGATFAAVDFRLALGNSLLIEGDYLDFTTLLAYLGTTKVQTWSGTAWQDVTSGNYTTVLGESLIGGSTFITAVPEASTSAYAMVGGLGTIGWLFYRRQRTATQKIAEQSRKRPSFSC